MSQSHDTAAVPRRSRFADNPGLVSVGPQPPAPAGPRPTYAELMAQVKRVDYSPLMPYLDDAVRTSLGLPDVPQPVTVDRATADRVRGYFLGHPGQIGRLPDRVRDLLNV